MKILAVCLMVVSGLVSGCIVVDPPYRSDIRGDRDGATNRVDRDRDRDGVPNRQDRRPDDAHRY